MKKTCSICNVIFECDSSMSCWCMCTPKISEKDLNEKNDCVQKLPFNNVQETTKHLVV